MKRRRDTCSTCTDRDNVWCPLHDERCDCCGKPCRPEEWDGLYSACHACAFEQSLEHFPCDHGTARALETL